MPLLAISLRFSGPAARVWLRELCGADEQLVVGSDTAAAVALLDRLLVARPGAAFAPGEAAQLATADRDQVLAALCSATFGDRVDATVTCAQCGARFDLDFKLSELAASMVADLSPAPPGGVFSAEGGARFRLPTGADELAVAGLPPEQAEADLLARCLVSGDPAADGTAVLAAMEQFCPTLDLDLDAACSECGHRHAIPFSVQAWLLGHLERSRQLLPRQVHLLARAYGWSLDAILSLPRQQRLALVALVEEERRAAVARPRP